MMAETINRVRGLVFLFARTLHGQQRILRPR